MGHGRHGRLEVVSSRKAAYEAVRVLRESTSDSEIKLRVNKDGIPSRAYIAFKNETQVATFSRAYDGHVFRDKAGEFGSRPPRRGPERRISLARKGNESHALVEYAPFQKVPTEKKKTDARNNTIDTGEWSCLRFVVWRILISCATPDENYLSFLESLKGTKTESVSLDTLSEWICRALNIGLMPSLLRRSVAASQPPPRPTTTPLLEALKAEKSAQKDKEAILRNHAHYKDATATTSGKKEDAKKKAVVAAPAPAVKLPDPPTPSSKKARKTAAQKAQDGQGALGKSPPAGGGGGGAVPSSVKTPVPATRHRPPKEPHGRSHSGKGDTSAVPSTLSSGPGPTQPLVVTTENVTPGPPASGPVPAQVQRKNRPVIGLGRHFEAALNGAGVAVAPGPGPGGDRKRRDKGGESGPGPGSTEGGAGKGKKHREERQRPPEVVPSILQRPEVGPDVVIVQRPQSPRGTEGHGEVASPGSGAGGGAGGGASVRGARRGRGRGRGGHRGG